MDSPQYLLAVENERQGRVMSAGRYWLGLALLIGIYSLGFIGGKLDAPNWLLAIGCFLFSTAYALVFLKFKKRTIR